MGIYSGFRLVIYFTKNYISNLLLPMITVFADFVKSIRKKSYKFFNKGGYNGRVVAKLRLVQYLLCTVHNGKTAFQAAASPTAFKGLYQGRPV